MVGYDLAIGFQRFASAATATICCFGLVAGACGGGSDLPDGLVFDSLPSTTSPPPSSIATPTTSSATEPTTSSTTVAPSVDTSIDGSDVDETTPDPAPTNPSPTLPASADESATAPRVQWNGDDGFLLGANLPWYNFGCDFGCGPGARGGVGVSSDDTLEAVAEVFETGVDAGLGTVRWWLFPGDPWQITTGPDGLPNGINENVYTDLDAALALADWFDIQYVFTLFSGAIDIPDAWLDTEEGRQRLTETLAELFARYGDHPRIMTWQLVNEPEWQIWNAIEDLEPVQDLAAKVSAAIHENSDALSSIGSAHLGGIVLWRDAGLDYYTAHWYDPMSTGIECALCASYSDQAAYFGIDLPIVIGEYYAAEEINVTERLESFYQRGYAGAFAWSLLPDQTSDHFEIDLEGVAAFAEARSDDLAP